MRRIDTEILRLSHGRMRFDARRRQLSTHDEEGRTTRTIPISEAAPRNWLQRLLLAGSGGAGVEPHERAILLLVHRLTGAPIDATAVAEPTA